MEIIPWQKIYSDLAELDRIPLSCPHSIYLSKELATHFLICRNSGSLSQEQDWARWNFFSPPSLGEP